MFELLMLVFFSQLLAMIAFYLILWKLKLLPELKDIPFPTIKVLWNIFKNWVIKNLKSSGVIR